jgi:hypothetical protein
MKIVPCNCATPLPTVTGVEEKLPVTSWLVATSPVSWA